MTLRATTNFLSPHWPGKAKLSAAVHNHFFRCFSENEMPASLSFAELVDFITEEELPFDMVSLMRIYTITKKNI